MIEDELMVFEENSTGRWLVVERTSDQYEFNSYLFDKNKNLLDTRIVSTLFDKSVSVNDDGLAKACDGAMELYGIEKTDVLIAELSEISTELEATKNELQRKQNEQKIQDAFGFHFFEEIKEQYQNAVDLSNSEKKKWSYKEVTDYLKSIVNDVMVTSDGDKIAISDDYDHIEKSSSFNELNRRSKEEIKTYAAEINKLVSNSEFQKEIENKDSAKVDVEKFKYYTVPVWINNRAYNVLLECGQLKNETSDNATRKGEPNNTYTEVSKEKYIRKHGKLQVLDISYLYNIRNRPLLNNKQINTEKSSYNNLAKEYNGLLKDYDENIKDYNELLSAYNKSQEENRKLKAQLRSHNKNNSTER